MQSSILFRSNNNWWTESDLPGFAFRQFAYKEARIFFFFFFC